MARTIYVQSARVRIDKTTGEQKPLRQCEQCSKEITVGSAYKHISIKTGPRSALTRYRCADCPDWQIWDYSSSLQARIAQIDYQARQDMAAVEDIPSVENVLSETGDAIRDLADEKRTNAQNIEDGFGHSTAQSEELAEQADALDDWAQEFESVDIPELPDPEEADCETCSGTGQITEEGAKPVMQQCPDCSGTGHPSTPTEDQMNTWRDEVADALSDILDNCPV